MAISTYAELKTAIANWLKRDDLTARIPEFVSLAEDRIAQDPRLRLRAMETTSDISISTRSSSLPTGFVGVRRIYLSLSPNKRLDFMVPDDYWSRYGASTTGEPSVYTMEGDNILVGPVPDTTYTGKILYWKRFTALSADGDTNWILSNARGLLLYGALIEAAPYLIDDPRIAVWSALFDDLADKVFEANKRDRVGSGAIARTEYTVA